MFDNLLYIFSKDTIETNNSLLTNNYYVREVDKLNKILEQKNNELKLLCGFPLSYKLPDDVDKYDLFGNMVIPNVVEGVLKCIF